MSLQYEPSSKPLEFSAKYFSRREQIPYTCATLCCYCVLFYSTHVLSRLVSWSKLRSWSNFYPCQNAFLVQLLSWPSRISCSMAPNGTPAQAPFRPSISSNHFHGPENPSNSTLNLCHPIPTCDVVVKLLSWSNFCPGTTDHEGILHVWSSWSCNQ